MKAGGSYISLLRGSKKFAIVKVGVDFLDIGINFKGAAPKSARLATSGSWNAMVTHRVRLNESDDFDKEIAGWLKAAYDSANASSASTSAKKR